MPLHEGVTWKTLVSYGQMSWWRRGTGDELEEGGTQNYDKISYESNNCRLELRYMYMYSL